MINYLFNHANILTFAIYYIVLYFGIVLYTIIINQKQDGKRL